MTSDALTSAGVALAAVVIATTGGNDWLDPVASLVIALVIAARAVQLLRATTSVLLESTPADLDLGVLVAAMTAARADVPGATIALTWDVATCARAGPAIARPSTRSL